MRRFSVRAIDIKTQAPQVFDCMEAHDVADLTGRLNKVGMVAERIEELPHFTPPVPPPTIPNAFTIHINITKQAEWRLAVALCKGLLLTWLWAAIISVTAYALLWLLGAAALSKFIR